MAISQLYEVISRAVQQADAAYGLTESEILSLKGNIQRLMDEIGQAEEQIRQQEQQLSINESEINGAESEIANLEGQINQLEAEQESSEDNDDEEGGTIDHGAEISSLQSQIGPLQNRINTLQAENQRIQEQIQQLQAESQRLTLEKQQKEQTLGEACNKCAEATYFLSAANNNLMAEASKNQGQSTAFRNIAGSRYGHSAANAASQVDRYAQQKTQLAQEAGRLAAAFATLAGISVAIANTADNGYGGTNSGSASGASRISSFGNGRGTRAFGTHSFGNGGSSRSFGTNGYGNDKNSGISGMNSFGNGGSSNTLGTNGWGNDGSSRAFGNSGFSSYGGLDLDAMDFVDPSSNPVNLSPQELYSTASNVYRETVDALRAYNVSYLPIKPHSAPITQKEIVERVGGGDCTEGSCSSLAFAYIGNRAGYDVLDFRGGSSRTIFADRRFVHNISSFPGVKSTRLSGTDMVETTHQLLNLMEEEKEYYLGTGEHAAIIRKKFDHFEYLELQEEDRNGWYRLSDYSLMTRFGCITDLIFPSTSYLMEVDSLAANQEFLSTLGYINTIDFLQQKGKDGHAK